MPRKKYSLNELTVLKEAGDKLWCPRWVYDCGAYLVKLIVPLLVIASISAFGWLIKQVVTQYFQNHPNAGL